MRASVDTRPSSVADYFARLAGCDVTPETSLQLGSAKIGAAESWLRRQAIVYNRPVLASGRFTLAQLLAIAEVEGASSAATEPPPPQANPRTDGPAVGIDIEARSSLPDTDDFRTHPFYADNFTARELAHCLERPDPKESLCGLWAAKEAIRKLHGAPGIATSLKAIEIVYDRSGQPSFSGVGLSISHAGEFAVAVAFRPTALVIPAPLQTPPRIVSLGPSLAALALSLLALAGVAWALFR
jgi:phosphopantetheine--protein transferase-like protein